MIPLVTSGPNINMWHLEARQCWKWSIWIRTVETHPLGPAVGPHQAARPHQTLALSWICYFVLKLCSYRPGQVWMKTESRRYYLISQSLHVWYLSVTDMFCITHQDFALIKMLFDWWWQAFSLMQTGPGVTLGLCKSPKDISVKDFTCTVLT